MGNETLSNYSKGAAAGDQKQLEQQHSSSSSSYNLPLTNAAPPYGILNLHEKSAIPLPNNNSSSSSSSSTRDTFFVFLTLTFISITLYFTFFLWRKHRQRPIGTIYKLEEYRYSRLSQNEVEVDSVVFYGDASSLQPEITQNNSDDDDEDVACKPATLHVETDSLINVSNCKTNGPTSLSNAQQQPPPPKSKLEQLSRSTPSILLQDSDEDLLQ